MPDSRFGCVALLDALGTRTANLEQSFRYLEALTDIRNLLAEFERSDDDGGHGRVKPEHPGGEFTIRFFADSILITLPCDREHLNWVPIARMFSGVAAVIAASFNRGILFRGAIAVGDYIETPDAVLGPAVLDVASWYEMPDMFTVMATPKAMFFVRRLLLDTAAIEAWPVGAIRAMGVPYSVPLKDGKRIDTHIVDWTFSAWVHFPAARDHLERWFLGAVSDLLVSPVVESKYRHTLESLQVLRAASRMWKE